MATKTDLTDVTFLTLIRLDSIDRLENILLITEFINKYFKTNILLLEVNAYNNKILSRLLPKNVKIDFIRNYDPIFHRTHYLNKIVEKTDTAVISLWDSDVLVDKMQIECSVDLIRKNTADIVLPYNGKFLDTSKMVRELYMETRDIDVLKQNENKMRPLYLPDPVGGALFANKKVYVESGMENEHLYGWGNHDGERINRWEILNYRVKRVEGPLYHLSHTRSINSRYHSNKQGETKRAELERLALMSKNEMVEEISKWHRSQL